MRQQITALALMTATVCFAEGPIKASKTPQTALRKVRDVLSNEDSKQIVHQAFSAGCFNKCWTFIDKTKRTDEDVENMLLLANASLWHWKQRTDCKPTNLAIAYWQLGRVNCLSGDTDLAKLYGRKCVKISLDAKLSPFSLGYGYEVLVHAFILEDKLEGAEKYLALAESELTKVESKEDRELLQADLSKLRKRLVGLRQKR
ncbi:MAG: hypothetical protein QGI24_03185 [Kiritimatiellia bacterium]|nr:hypothetical protein [Kiritimatiellia bacterium]MDP6847767.1 hypothetical protein [Kiritimatiellia bacterium]